VFSVTFSGTPPFSFTYTRSEQIGSRSKVFETQVDPESHMPQFVAYNPTDRDGHLDELLLHLIHFRRRLRRDGRCGQVL